VAFLLVVGEAAERAVPPVARPERVLWLRRPGTKTGALGEKANLLICTHNSSRTRGWILRVCLLGNTMAKPRPGSGGLPAKSTFSGLFPPGLATMIVYTELGGHPLA
jgi:hypothetical protein